MEHVALEVQERTVRGKKVKQLRAQDQIPAVVYGPDTPPKPIQIESRSLHRVLQRVGTTALINLAVEGGSAPYAVLAREVQRDILTGQLQHVDFYQVRLTETVRTTPRLVFVGQSPMVKSGEAVLIHGMNEVEVECLPADLIDTIEVDISGLESLGDSVLVGDLSVPPAVTIVADPDEVVISLVTTRAAAGELDEEEMLEEGVLEGEEAAAYEDMDEA